MSIPSPNPSLLGRDGSTTLREGEILLGNRDTHSGSALEEEMGVEVGAQHDELAG